jgi:hypothetical protein
MSAGSEGVDWQTAFRAISALVGEPVEAIDAALGGGETSGRAEADLVRALASTSRDVRARAVARVVAEVVADIERTRLV